MFLPAIHTQRRLDPAQQGSVAPAGQPGSEKQLAELRAAIADLKRKREKLLRIRDECARESIRLNHGIQRTLRLMGALLESSAGLGITLSRSELLLSRELKGVPPPAEETDDHQTFALRMSANLNFFSEARMSRIRPLLDAVAPIWAKGLNGRFNIL